MAKKTFEILEKAADILNVPSEAVAGTPRVTVTGTQRVHIENHRGLLGYTADEVLVNAVGKMIKISGSGLELDAMSDMELVVTGSVRSVEFVS